MKNSKSFPLPGGHGTELCRCAQRGRGQDYDGLDVNGKIALVSRGSVEYNVKKEAAKNAGAAGILVYNNLNRVCCICSWTSTTCPAPSSPRRTARPWPLWRKAPGS